MRIRPHAIRYLLILVLLVMDRQGALDAQVKHHVPDARVVRLNPASAESLAVLTGPPMTVSLWSGYMVLAPSTHVGRHTTGIHEEAIVVLAGSGELRIADGNKIFLSAPCVAYCPPATVHDVFNTGKDTLRYVWIVAPAKEGKQFEEH